MSFRIFLNSALVCFALFFVLGCETKKVIAGEILSDTKAENSKEAERKKILENYLGDINFTNLIAINIANCLRQVLFLGEPVSSPEPGVLGVRVLEAAGGTKSIAVVPILPGDEDVSAEWELEIMSGPSFKAEFPLLILGGAKISHFWNGLMMLREGSRVVAFATGAFEAINDPFDREVADEYCAYAILFEVLDQEGGEKYKKILLEKAELIRKRFLKDKSYLSIDFSDEHSLNDAFDEAPVTEGEIHLRWQILWIHATFVAMENMNNFKNEKRAKIEYMETLLKNF